MPEGRGGGGFSWRILDNDKRGAIVFHLVDTGIDTGSIIYRQNFVFPDHCLHPIDYENYQLELNKKAVDSFIYEILTSDFWRQLKPLPQEVSNTSYYPRLSTQFQGFINWNWSAEEIISFIQAFSYPYEGAKTYTSSGCLAYIHEAYLREPKAPFHPFKTGLVYHISPTNVFHICCRDKIIEIKPEKIKLVHKSAEKSLRLGDRLHTPQMKLDDALLFRPSYSTSGLANQITE